jgi:polynucleotide 5'-hydroxyl-kinase GRC3/NOL9
MPEFISKKRVKRSINDASMVANIVPPIGAGGFVHDVSEGELGEFSGPDTTSDSDEDMAVPTTAPPAARRERRAWSPSRPPLDSSDEEDDDLPSVIPAASAPTQAEPVLLSTFTPVPGQNTFSLSGDAGCVAIVLRAGETLTLIGTFTLSLVRGAVSFAGVTLTPSHNEHRVFSPRCSPLPSIIALSPTQKDNVFDLVPAEVAAELGPADSVIILRSLSTGVEALGKICRTFDRLFQPLRATETGSSQLGIPGVHLVTRSLPVFDRSK